eukprot:TRINITY_DN4367_c0_g1_i1.p1 TRINITY_DN4367_c0_g1~~TRINITY_DN4367_c0_g1_i1.p1  ORF type:complete len:373 (-),score=52.09 TRINITY_DN4367_c0_g1_i1:32-1150(-)
MSGEYARETAGRAGMDLESRVSISGDFRMDQLSLAGRLRKLHGLQQQPHSNSHSNSYKTLFKIHWVKLVMIPLIFICVIFTTVFSVFDVEDSIFMENLDNSNFEFTSVTFTGFDAGDAVFNVTANTWIKGGAILSFDLITMYYGGLYIGEGRSIDPTYLGGDENNPDVYKFQLSIMKPNETGFRQFLMGYYALTGQIDDKSSVFVGKYSLYYNTYPSGQVSSTFNISQLIPRADDTVIGGSYFGPLSLTNFTYSSQKSILIMTLTILNTLKTPALMGNVNAALVWTNSTESYVYASNPTPNNIIVEAGSLGVKQLEYLIVNDDVSSEIVRSPSTSLSKMRSNGVAYWSVGSNTWTAPIYWDGIAPIDGRKKN